MYHSQYVTMSQDLYYIHQCSLKLQEITIITFLFWKQKILYSNPFAIVNNSKDMPAYHYVCILSEHDFELRHKWRRPEWRCCDSHASRGDSDAVQPSLWSGIAWLQCARHSLGGTLSRAPFPTTYATGWREFLYTFRSFCFRRLKENSFVSDFSSQEINVIFSCI